MTTHSYQLTDIAPELAEQTIEAIETMLEAEQGSFTYDESSREVDGYLNDTSGPVQMHARLIAEHLRKAGISFRSLTVHDDPSIDGDAIFATVWSNGAQAEGICTLDGEPVITASKIAAALAQDGGGLDAVARLLDETGWAAR